MSQWFYLIALLFSIAGLGVLDYKHKLALFHDSKRTLLTIGAAMAVFIVWDIFGIFFGVFFHGQSPYALPYLLAPEFPLEELFFLFLLSYVTLLIYLLMRRRYA